MTIHPFPRIAVYGAYGHTGRFVVTELLRRGFVPVACGRDATRLHELAAMLDGTPVTESSLHSAAEMLERAGTAKRHRDRELVRKG